MVVLIILFSCPSRSAGIVDGEKSEERIEKQAANREPHISSRFLDWLGSAGIGACDDAAFCQSSGTARGAVETATTASVRLRRGLRID